MFLLLLNKIYLINNKEKIYFKIYLFYFVKNKNETKIKK
jgi:hypothetical protein